MIRNTSPEQRVFEVQNATIVYNFASTSFYGIDKTNYIGILPLSPLKKFYEVLFTIAEAIAMEFTHTIYPTTPHLLPLSAVDHSLPAFHNRIFLFEWEHMGRAGMS